MSSPKISLKNPLLLLAVWLFFTQSFQWITFNRIRLTEADKKDCDTRISCLRFNPHPLDFLQMHTRQDSEWYFNIAYQGYSFSPDQQSNTNFFPLYPVLMKLVYPLLVPFTPGLTLYFRFLLSGVFISLVSLSLAIPLLYRLLARESDPDTALLSVFLLLAFPVSYFLTAVYSESLFLLLIVLFFYCLRNQKFFLTGIAGLFAALTRSVGLILIIPLGMELFRYLRSSPRKSILLYLSLLLIPLGSGIFSTYLYARFHRPLAFIEAADNWGRRPGMITSLSTQFRQALNFSSSSAANYYLEIFYLLFGLASVFLLLKSRRPEWTVWSVISVIFPLTTGVLVSQPRYTLVLLPIFFAWAGFLKSRPLPQYLYLLVSLALLGMHTVLFVNGHWSF